MLQMTCSGEVFGKGGGDASWVSLQSRRTAAPTVGSMEKRRVTAEMAAANAGPVRAASGWNKGAKRSWSR